MAANILLVEDEPAIQELIAVNLQHAGHHVIRARDAEGALGIVKSALPDLLLIDWMLPGMSGVSLARQLRQEERTRQIPIIMLTARSDDFDVVAGLEAGADDYVAKPVEPRVLDARIRAVLRRSAADQPGGPAAAAEERHGDLVIDRSALEVTKRGVPVSLTPTELKLLLELARTPGQVYSRQQILSAVWDHDYLGDSRLVDACVQRLRAKIEDVPAHPEHVQTVRGFGYRFGRS